MIRRKFLQLVALSGASAVASLEGIAGTASHPTASVKSRTAVFQVKGFSCVTCAIGLDTMYSRKKGIVSSQSTYPEGRVTVQFDQSSIDEKAVRAVITDAGFAITAEQMS